MTESDDDHGIVVPEINQEILDRIELDEDGKIIDVDNIIEISDEYIDRNFDGYIWSEEEKNKIREEVESSITEEMIEEKLKEFNEGKLPKSEQDEINEKINADEINNQIDHIHDMENQLKKLLEEVQELDENLQNRRSKKDADINKLNDEYDKIKNEIQEIDEKIEEKTSRLDKLKKDKPADANFDSSKINKAYKKICSLIQNLNDLILSLDSKSKGKYEIEENEDDKLATLNEIKNNIEKVVDDLIGT